MKLNLNTSDVNVNLNFPTAIPTEKRNLNTSDVNVNQL